MKTSLPQESTVSLVILTYNGKAVLPKCLDSALSQTYSMIETILVDNGSTDGSYELALGKYGSRIRIVRNELDLGYPAALNKAASMCGGQLLVFLNDDAALHPKAIEELVRATAEYPDFDFFQPKILLADKPDVINSTGLDIHYCGFGSLAEGGERASQSVVARELLGVHGACFMARAKAFREVGSFDGSFFAFYEDTDLSWRVLLSGRRIIYVPSAIVYHRWGQAWGVVSSSKIRIAERNRLMMVLTNYDRATLILLTFPILCTELGLLVWATKHHILHAKISSYADLIVLRKHLRSRRRIIKAIRRESDFAMLEKFTSELNQVILGGPWLRPTRFLYKLFRNVVIRHL